MQANSFFKKMQGILVSGMTVVLCAVLIVGCSSKDDEPEPEPLPEIPSKPEVKYYLTSLSFRSEKNAGFKIEYYPEKNGEKIKTINCENGAIITFDVPDQPKGGDSGKMAYSLDGTDTQVNFKFNASGYVSHAESIEDGTTKETWDFAYNKDGYLIHVKRSLDNMDMSFTYEEGNLTKLSVKSDKSETDREASITYFKTCAALTNGIEKNFYFKNEGSISFLMPYYYWFRIDLGLMRYAVYDNILGRATKNLPASYNDNGVYGKRVYHNDAIIGWSTIMTYFTGFRELNDCDEWVDVGLSWLS